MPLKGPSPKKSIVRSGYVKVLGKGYLKMLLIYQFFWEKVKLFEF